VCFFGDRTPGHIVLAVEDGALADGLGAHLRAVAFVELAPDEVSSLLIDAVEEWATGHGWRAYRRAASVVPLPAPYSQQHSVVDVGIARAGQPPVVVEVDHGDRKRTVDKLVAEAAAGRVAIWVRWGTGRLAPGVEGLLRCGVGAGRPGALGGAGGLRALGADRRPRVTGRRGAVTGCRAVASGREID
jgi:hypothetical protein